MAAKRTWLWVILGIFGTIVLFVVVVIGGAIYEFRSHVKNEVVASTVAEEEFARQRERFHGQQPLVELVEGRDDRDDVPTVHHPPSDARPVELHTLRVLIYDINNSRLIHADVPGWLLRMMRDRSGRDRGAMYGSGGWMYGSGFDMSRSRVTMDDIERHGYGLVMDGHNRNTRILVWSE
jgi:hypothetical protein